MSLFNVFNVAGSAMSAQAQRLNTTASNLAIALALFPDIQDQVVKAGLQGQKPRLLPFVMAKQVEQAKLAAAHRVVGSLAGLDSAGLRQLFAA